MRKKIIDEDYILDTDRRLVSKIYRVDKSKDYPFGIEFAFQYLYFQDNEWKQIARIDNQLHEGRPGTHIHALGKRIGFEEISVEDAKKRLIEIAEEIIGRLK
jgi:hypothetical protein